MRRLMLFIFIFLFVFTSHAQETDIPPRPIITPENAHELTQIAQLGRGNILDIAFSDDENTLLVASTIGIWEYDMADLSAPPEWTEIYLYSQSDYLSPNGQYLIIKNPIVGFKVYDIVQKEVVSGSEGIDFTDVIFSPQSDKLAYMTSNQINVWDIATRALSFYFGIPDDVEYVRHMRFSPDGKSLAMVFQLEDDDAPDELWIWDIATSTEIRHFQIPQTSDIEWSPDGETFLITGGDEAHAHLISATTGATRQIFTSQFAPRLGGELTFSPDGQQVALASNGTIVYGSAPYNPSGIIYIWDVEFSEPMVILSGHVQSLQQAIFSPTARYVAGAGRDGMLRVWDARNGEEIAHIRDHALIRRYSLNSTIGMIAIGDSETAIHVWDTDTFTEQVMLNMDEYEGAMIFNQFSPDGRYLLSFHNMESPLSVWDTTTWQLHSSTFAWRYNNITFHPTLPIIVFGDKWYSQSLWNYETGEGIDGFSLLSIEIIFSPHASWLIYNDMPDIYNRYGNDAVVFDMQTHDIIDILHHPESISPQHLSPDGQLLAVTVSRNDETWVWDTNTWTLRYILEGTGGKFSSDSRQIITRPNLQTLNFYDAQSGEILYTVTTRPDKDLSIPVFSPDSRLMAIATNDGVIRLHDTATGDIVYTLNTLRLANLSYLGSFYNIRWSEDGRLIMVDYDGVAHIFAIGDTP
jgi:WD40 repeat protein